jgi:hypothetical protein
VCLELGANPPTDCVQVTVEFRDPKEIASTVVRADQRTAK